MQWVPLAKWMSRLLAKLYAWWQKSATGWGALVKGAHVALCVCVWLWQVWEVGVLAYEMLTGGHPLPGYPNKYGKPGSIMYSLSGVQPLPDTYPKGNHHPPPHDLVYGTYPNPIHVATVTSALDTLLCSMLGFDAGRRPSLASVLFTAKDISNSLQGSDPTVNAGSARVQCPRNQNV